MRGLSIARQEQRNARKRFYIFPLSHMFGIWHIVNSTKKKNVQQPSARCIAFFYTKHTHLFMRVGRLFSQKREPWIVNVFVSVLFLIFFFVLYFSIVSGPGFCIINYCDGFHGPCKEICVFHMYIQKNRGGRERKKSGQPNGRGAARVMGRAVDDMVSGGGRRRASHVRSGRYMHIFLLPIYIYIYVW